MCKPFANLDEFEMIFPDAEWLEDYQGFERWTNGEGEGSEYESEWFCSETGLHAIKDGDDFHIPELDGDAVAA